jgi:hypothetical protein
MEIEIRINVGTAVSSILGRPPLETSQSLAPIASGYAGYSLIGSNIGIRISMQNNHAAVAQ